MARTSIPTDPDSLKPIIEAMIFASEEPLSPRTLLRLLVGEADEAELQPETPPLVAMMETEGTAAPAVEQTAAGESGTESGETAISGTDESEAVVSEDAAISGAKESEAVISKTDASLENRTDSNRPETPAPDDAGSDEGLTSDVIDATVNEGKVETTGSIVEEGGAGSEPEPAAATGTNEIQGEAGELAAAFERAESWSSGKRGASAGETLNQRYIRRLIEELNLEYDETRRAFRIVEVAGGFQFATIRDYGEWVALLSKEKLRRRLSPAALETLAIIAYRQPVSKPEIESIRGVNCDQVLLSLLEKNLVSITGRSEGVGRPLLYGTTDDFLRAFGLNTVTDLPKLREIEELMEEDAFTAERTEVITVEEGTDVAEIEARVGAAGHIDEEAQEGLPIEPRTMFDPDAVESPESRAEETTDESEGEGTVIEEVIEEREVSETAPSESDRENG